MAPKKAKGAVSGAQGQTVFSEVERAFYDLQLADCNRKLARLRKTVDDLENSNEDLRKAYDKLDEDRADIISYLKKTLAVKNEENAELKEKVKSLEELREIETAEFQETVNELERNFTRMKDQLTSENKLLAGKLNTLEEFRAIREDLMQKFDKQERAYEDQELKYKRIIYNAEKKFVIGKDKLKKEMEGRLLQLAQEFQDASEMRIAASTHRVIRENIALNNQLDSLLMTQAKVAQQNEQYKEDVRASRCAKEVAEEERDKAMNKSIVQLKVIDQLTIAFEDEKKQKALYEKKRFNTERIQNKLDKLTKENANLLLRVRILEQNLHATMGEQNKSVVETAKLLRERETFKNILKESASAVQASLKLDQWSSLDPSREILDREIVLTRILDIINQFSSATHAESMESLVSLSKIYEKGYLGPEVQPVISRKQEASVTGLTTTASQQSLKEKRSAGSGSTVSTSTKESLKTIPSIELVSTDEASLPTPMDSLPSFTVTSLHSSYIASAEEEQTAMTEVSKMLALSKLEIQKSLMADLALSQMSRPISTLGLSTSVTSAKRAFSSTSKLTIPKSGASESQVHLNKPKQDLHVRTKDTSEPTQDTSEPTQVTSEPTEPTSEPTQATSEPTQATSEPTQPTGEPSQGTAEPELVDKTTDEKGENN